MRAWISGEAGAYSWGQGEVRLVNFFDPERSYAVASEVGVFQRLPDSEELEFDSEREAKEEALIRYRTYLAFRLFLLLCDPESNIDDREEIALELEELLGEDVIYSATEDRIYSQALPEADSITVDLSAKPNLKRFLGDLQAGQPGIVETRAAFDQIPDDLFSKVSRAHFEHLAVKKGAFRTLARVHASADKRNLAIFQTLKQMANVPDSRQIVHQWTETIRDPLTRQSIAREQENEWVSVQSADGTASRQIYENVRKQQVAIIDKLHAGNIDSAVRFAADMVRSQTKGTDETEYVSKSLCLISQEAKRLELFDLQQIWASQAVALRSEDPFTHGQLADAFINLGRMDEAEASLKLVEAGGDRLFAATGRARILREIGKLAESRNAYLEAARAYSSEPKVFHALAGAAAVAREMGNHEQSLSEYEAALAAHPHEEYLLAGKVATLSELGRWADAHTALSALERIRGSDLELLTLRAGIHRTAGNLDTCIEQYEKLVRNFSYDPLVHLGLVDSLRVAGRHSDALAAWAKANERHPRNRALFAAGLDLKREMGRVDEALTDFSDSSIEIGNSSRLIGALVRLYRAAQMDEKALALVDEATKSFPFMFWLRLHRADLLKRMGSVQDALHAYNDLLAERPQFSAALNSKAALLAASGRVDDALSTLPAVNDPSTEDQWRSYILRGVILNKAGRVNEALVHLNILAKTIPFARERRMFSNAVTMAELAANNFAVALRASEWEPSGITNVIHFHALAAARDQRATTVYANNDGLTAKLIVLKEEIARRYQVASGTPSHSTEWLFIHENNELMLEAA